MANYISVKTPRLLSRASSPISFFQLENPVRKKVAFLSLISSVLICQTVAASANGITYKVRLENGSEQAYHLEVPAGIEPVKLKPGEWNQPQYATDKISQNAATVAAVGWAGGLEDHDSGGPPNSLTNLGGKKPGGFYNATYIKVDSAELQPGPIPNYLVQMNGKIGQIRQTFYADVLEDGRIVRPVPVSSIPEASFRKSHRHHGGKQWGGAEWGGSGEKKKWGGAEEKKKWGGAEEKKKWGGAEQKPTPSNQSQ
jgi:hypothetical protein